MKGYYNKPEETAILLRRHPDGRVWAHTGDMGYLDEDGFVYLDSRIKRMIIRHDGFKVFPSMIENVVSRHPAVHQCSVVGCADKDHVQGRLPFVYIVLKADTTAKKKQGDPGAGADVRRGAARIRPARGLQVYPQYAHDPCGQGRLPSARSWTSPPATIDFHERTLLP